MKRRLMFVIALMLGAVGMLFTTKVSTAQQPTIKVGVLHSLSGTMAISETTLKDTILMMIDEQNKKGGLLGRKLEAVVVDPASNWPLFAEKAAQLAGKGQSRGRVRMLDFGFQKIRASGFREETTDCSSTPSSTKVKSLRRTSSIPALRRISRRFRRWIT